MFFFANKFWKILDQNNAVVQQKDNKDLIKSLFEKHRLKAIYLVNEQNKLKLY